MHYKCLHTFSITVLGHEPIVVYQGKEVTQKFYEELHPSHQNNFSPIEDEEGDVHIENKNEN